MKQKKKIGCLITWIMILCVGLTACAKSGNGKDNPTAGKENDTQASGTQGYVFAAGTTEIRIDSPSADYVAKLGDPKGGYYEAKSCAFEGLDKFWYYDGFTLQAYQKNGTDTVYSVTLTDDTVKTKEGVKIGDSKDKMTAAYGSSYQEKNAVCSYTSGNMVLEFTIKDDTIASIVYTLKSN